MPVAELAPLLNETRAAEIVGIAPQTLCNRRCAGRPMLPFVRVGTRIRYRIADLEQFISDNTTFAVVNAKN